MTRSIVEFLVSKINTFANFDRKEINNLGNHTSFWFATDIDRYVFDFDPLLAKQGWTQYDTTQDAPYFGVWVNLAALCTLTYAEGDISLTECPTQSQFATHMQQMVEFYGDPPPAAVVINLNGTQTEFYDNRPEVNKLFSFADVIHTYGQKDAINDGLLFPVPTPLQKQAGFNFPVILTLKVWDLYVEWTEKDSEQQVYQNEDTRLLKVLEALHYAIKHNKADDSLLYFQVNAIPRDGQSNQPHKKTLLSKCHPGDYGEPVITIMHDALDD